MKTKIDILGLIASILMGISIFLPFFGVDPVTVPGISFKLLWGVLFLAGIGIFLAIKRSKFIILPGAISLIFGLLIFANIFKNRIRFRFLGESESFHMSEVPKVWGFYFFLIASAAVIIAGIIIIMKKKENKEEILK